MLRCCMFTSTGAVLISHVESTSRSSHFMIRAPVLGFIGQSAVVRYVHLLLPDTVAL